MRRLIYGPAVVVFLLVAACGSPPSTAPRAHSPAFDDRAVNAGANIRIHITRIGSYSWTSPATKGLSTKDIESYGAGWTLEGGSADVAHFLAELTDAPDGLTLTVTFTVNSFDGDPYLIIPNAGSRRRADSA